MRLKASAIALLLALSCLAACGGGTVGPPPVPPTFTVQILSDAAYDGDIEQTSPTTFTITQGMGPTVQSVFAGTDPVAGTEFRAFLDFPLTGPGGVPGDALIDAASLQIFINDLQPPAASSTLVIELVSFQPPTLIATDFDPTIQPPLAQITLLPPLTQADVGNYVTVDVTPLMDAAQQLGLPDFQVRIRQQVGTVAALAQINDSTGADRATRAPLLTVTYE